MALFPPTFSLSILLLFLPMSSFRRANSPCWRYVVRSGRRPGRIPMSSALVYVFRYLPLPRQNRPSPGIAHPRACLLACWLANSFDKTLIAYAGSAGVAILGLIVQYILFHISPGEEQLLQQQQQRQLRLPRANPFDALFLGTLRGAFGVFGIKFSWLNTPWQGGRFRAALDRVSERFGILCENQACFLIRRVCLVHPVHR